MQQCPRPAPPLSRQAAIRTPSSPIDTRLSRLGVRGVGFSLTFPLATPLIPTTSAGSPLWLHLLFGGFFGTTGLNFGCCDFSPAWATGLRLWALPVPPVPCGSGTDEISQLACSSLPNMLRVSDRAGSEHVLRLTSCSVVPSGIATPWASRLIDFAALWLAYWSPLSTLRPTPRDVQRMTRGLSDSPLLPSIELLNQLRSTGFCWRTAIILVVS